MGEYQEMMRDFENQEQHHGDDEASSGGIGLRESSPRSSNRLCLQGGGLKEINPSPEI